MIAIMEAAVAECQMALREMEERMAASTWLWAAKLQEMEAQVEVRRRAARAAAKATEKALKAQHERDSARHAAAITDREAALSAKREAVNAKEAAAVCTLADAKDRLDLAKQLMECHRAGKNRAAADASAAEAAQERAAADRKAAEAALAKVVHLQGAGDRAAALEAAVAEGMAANVVLHEEARALKSTRAALEEVAEATAARLDEQEAELQAAVRAAEQRAVSVTAERLEAHIKGEREVAKARERICWLERAEKHLRDELGGVREAYDMSHNEWIAALDRLWTERSVYKGALKELEEHAR